MLKYPSTYRVFLHFTHHLWISTIVD